MAAKPAIQPRRVIIYLSKHLTSDCLLRVAADEIASHTHWRPASIPREAGNISE
ncbi:hypothetical protein [Desulfocurvibacter africanus]|uniref:hypothetical protein n=1 Tax=Desulfocurvibacter africanus TaxID=873 RepID=UPI00034B2CB1|nr:hypothetical protein [Desulfocurvibacter africanus]